MRSFILSLLLLAASIPVLLACGSEALDDGFNSGSPGNDSALQAVESADSQGQVLVEKAVEVSDGSAQQFAVVESDDIATAVPEPATISTSGDQEFAREPNTQATNRVIVRNADVNIESDDASRAMREIGDIAARLGGWIVESNQATNSPVSSITIRVPAERFENAITAIERLATKVVSARVDSTDFTQEYTDLNASVEVLERTIASLTELLDTRRVSSDIEGILQVQREIANQQTLLETARGRLRFISESAAYSKIQVTISHLPVEMRIQVEREFNVPRKQNAQFAVTFWPPEDHDVFTITWDFGNASAPIQTTRAIRSSDDSGAFISSPVTAGFPDEDRDRYVGNVTVQASSDNSVARGTANFAINVYELPQLSPLVEVLNILPVRPGDDVVLRASFNEHRNVNDLQFEWSFGDGSEPVTGDIEEDETSISVTHSYTRYVPWNMQVALKLTGDSDAGDVSETAYADIYMEEDPTIQPSVFAPGTTATNAANLLVISAGYIGNVVVFLAVTSPFWLIVAGVIFLIIWLQRRSDRRRAATLRISDAPTTDQETDTRTDSEAAEGADNEEDDATNSARQ